MHQYLQLCLKVLETGKRKTNRTGIDHIGYQGDMMKFDLADGFPAVTTKKLFIKQVFGEMLCFLRGASNAADFRFMGCKVWDANANENEQWLANPNRKGVDDLGRIYGVQARDFGGLDLTDNDGTVVEQIEGIDQLHNVYEDLRKGIDNRREIVTHWNPTEMNEMALPPCHMFYQFGLEPLTVAERTGLLADKGIDLAEGAELLNWLDTMEVPKNRLNLSMYQRSCDVPLGIPFNIAGYAWLLSVMAQITNTVAGEFTHFMHDIHYYANQEDGLREQITREPMKLPTLWIDPNIKTLEDLETWATQDSFELRDYEHHPAIKFPFAV